MGTEKIEQIKKELQKLKQHERFTIYNYLQLEVYEEDTLMLMDDWEINYFHNEETKNIAHNIAKNVAKYLGDGGKYDCTLSHWQNIENALNNYSDQLELIKKISKEA